MELTLHTGLCQGRPQEERLPVETACYDFLDKLSISYYRVDHAPAHSIESCHLIEGTLGAPIAKNLFLCNRQKTQFYLLLMEGDKVFKTKYLSAQLGCSRLSFATGEDLMELLGVESGSASLLALLNDKNHTVTLVLDKPILGQNDLGLHPCRNTSTLRISMEDALKKVIPALGYEAKIVDLPMEEDAL